MNSQNFFSTLLLEWFDRFGRHDLPWQQDKTPYRIWVSEIMLQQTQVQTVIPYYQSFMARFPSLEDLAAADQEEVLSYWAGLGYYARGRNLHKTAQIVLRDYGGEFPSQLEQIMALPGIGRSTAGAILSIAFKQRAPILDGNVKRVLCRFDALEGWSGEKVIEARLWRRAEALTPKERFDDYTQAIMDLGATLCTRSRPQCESCPVKQSCRAFQQQRVAEFPYSKPKKDKPVRHTCMWLLQNEEKQIWLQKRPQQGIWGGLWSLPEGENLSLEKSRPICSDNLVKWPRFKHTFTHYHLWIEPYYWQVREALLLEGEWVALSDAMARGVPAPVTKLLKQLEKEHG